MPKKPRIVQVDRGEDKRNFIVVPFRAASDQRLNRQQLRALLCLASYSNRSGLAWVGTETLSKMMGISPSTTSYHIKKLEKLGYIRTVNKGYPMQRAYTRQIVFDPSISAEDAASITNDPAPFMIRQAENLFNPERYEMPRKKASIRNLDDANLPPRDVGETSSRSHLQTEALRQAVGAELFAALIQRCGPDATPEQLQAELRRMLA